MEEGFKDFIDMLNRVLVFPFQSRLNVGRNMATSSSDDSSCRAPDNFHISSSNGDSDSHLNNYCLRCPLCARFCKTFYCKNCVKSGDFIHSAHHLPERLSEKQHKYLNLKTSLRKCDDRCKQLLQKKILSENLKFEIKKKKEKIALLNRLITETKIRVNEKTKNKQTLINHNQLRSTILPKYEDKVKKLEDYVGDRVQRISKLHEQKCELLDRLKATIRKDLEVLIQYIFPISEIVLKHEQSSTTEVSDTIAELADAKNTSYIRGKWIFHGSGISEVQHVIIAPSLPANGDYSAYLDWIAHYKDEVPTSSAGNEALPSSNPAYRISAALTYATQLTNLLSFYLDVRLPYKLAYGDFCRKELSEQQFNRKVSRLNTNIMYLAYTQRVKLSLLNKNHTLENILEILNANDLGRIGPVEVSDAPLVRSVDSQVLIDLETGTESESDDENSLRQEWESVPHLTTHDPSPPILPSNQQATSVAGGLMTSAAAGLASFLRGWTGR